MNDEAQERNALLGGLGEGVIALFRFLQSEVTVPREGLVHVTHSESDVLRILLTKPGATVTTIASTFGQQRSNTSTRVASLVEKGLLEKVADGSDGRTVRVYPTQLAKDNLRGYRAIWAETLASQTTASTEELAVAVRVLTEIAERLEEHQPES